MFVILVYYRYTYKLKLQKEVSTLVYVYIYIYLLSSALLLTIKTSFDFSYITCFFFWFLFLLMLVQLTSFFVNIFILQRNNLYLLDNILFALFKTLILISVLEYIQSCDLDDVFNYLKVLNTLSLPNFFKLCLFIIDLSPINISIIIYKLYIFKNIINLYIIISEIHINATLYFLIYLFFFLGYGVLIFSIFLGSIFFLIFEIFSNIIFTIDFLFISFPNSPNQLKEKFNSIFIMKELGGNVDKVKKILSNYVAKGPLGNKAIDWNLKEQHSVIQKLKSISNQKLTWNSLLEFNEHVELNSKKLALDKAKGVTYGEILNRTGKLNYFSEMFNLYDICISKQAVKKIRFDPVIKDFFFKDYCTNSIVLNESLSNTMTVGSIESDSSTLALIDDRRELLEKYGNEIERYPVVYKLWVDIISNVEFSKIKREQIEEDLPYETLKANLLGWSQRLNFIDIVLSHNLKSKNIQLSENQIISSMSDYLHFDIIKGHLIPEITPLFFLNLSNCRMHNVLPIVSNLRLEFLKNPLISEVSLYNMKQVNLSGIRCNRKFWGDVIFSLRYIDGKYVQVTCELKNISKLALINQISIYGLDLLSFEKMFNVEIQKLENHTFIWYSSQIYNSFIKFNNLAPDVQYELLKKFNVTFCIGFDLSEIEKMNHVVYNIDDITLAYFQSFCKKLDYEINNNIGDIVAKKRLLGYLQEKKINIKFIKY